MKKILVLVVAIAMTFAMCSCGKKSSEEVVNPVHECTYDELVKKTGIDILIPNGAEEGVYAYIDGKNAEDVIAQATFKFDGDTYCYRAQSTAKTSIMANVDSDSESAASELAKALESGTNIGAALSGMHFKWECSATVDVHSSQDSQIIKDAICAWNEGKEGFITWLDVVPGYLYSLSMDKNCTQDKLMKMADTIFVPMQGNAG